jgi:hypothetical protein
MSQNIGISELLLLLCPYSYESFQPSSCLLPQHNEYLNTEPEGLINIYVRQQY